ncbi:MAG: HAMP domain-containing histidine kinase [Austwickia sp.]|jgi:two-component system sensor histidine kinase MtrB|nr:MAG: HAMP domain-containing histidine kinase [Austwickia sp.]
MALDARRLGRDLGTAADWLGRLARAAWHALRRRATQVGNWLARWWRHSLHFRVVVSTVLLCLVVMGLLQTFLYQRIADGLVDDRTRIAKEEAAKGAGSIQEALDKTDKLDADSLRQLTWDLVRAQESDSAEGVRKVILMRARANDVKDIVLPTLDTGIDIGVITDQMRDELAKNAGVQQVQIVTVPRGGEDVPAVVVGSIVRVPEAGPYELYYLYPLDRQQQILAMVVRTFLLGVLIFAVLVGLISHVVTRLVVDPVREAAVVAERLANGRLNERLDIKGEDDLAKLATAFNGMADALQAHISRLEDLSALQQRFVSDVSHELRTPLTTIRMAAEVIYDEHEKFPPVSARSTEILYGEVERFEELLGDLLEISRIDAGAANLDRENIDIRTVVDRVLTGLMGLARYKGSSITLVGAEEPLRAEMDPRRVERIIRNLVSNALEHGEGRPIRVEMGGNDAAVAVAVRDFGIGLRAGEADLVFTRFWRADPARKRTTGGTGLGLAIALEDARLHDGSLQAWGEPGVGSRFRLTLPRVAGRPIGYSPLPLADPTSAELGADGVPLGEPIKAAGDPTTSTLPVPPADETAGAIDDPLVPGDDVPAEGADRDAATTAAAVPAAAVPAAAVPAEAPADREPDVVDPELDLVDPELELVDREPDVVDPELDLVDPELDLIDPELDLVDPELDATP